MMLIRIYASIASIIRPHRTAAVPGTLEGDDAPWEENAPEPIATFGGGRRRRSGSGGANNVPEGAGARRRPSRRLGNPRRGVSQPGCAKGGRRWV